MLSGQPPFGDFDFFQLCFIEAALRLGAADLSNGVNAVADGAELGLAEERHGGEKPLAAFSMTKWSTWRQVGFQSRTHMLRKSIAQTF